MSDTLAKKQLLAAKEAEACRDQFRVGVTPIDDFDRVIWLFARFVSKGEERWAAAENEAARVLSLND